MAKTKSKVQVASSDVPSKVEDATSADAIAEPTPLDSVAMEELTTVVHDKSEEGDKKEETKDDAQVETMATDDVPEGEKVEEREKMEEVRDEVKVENASNEKAKTMGKKAAAIAEEVTSVVDNKSEEGDTTQETKDDGQVEPTATAGVPEGEKVEERHKMEELKNEEKGKNAFNKKAKRMRKKKKAAASAESKPPNSVAVEEVTTVVHDKFEGGDNKEETNNDGQVEPIATDGVPEGKKVKKGDKMEEVKDEEKGENASNKKTKRMRGKKKAASAAASSEANKSNDACKPGTSAAENKDLKKVDGMGLIFMCNAKTKQDCFEYKVLGLPASKKDLVAKVYKGMRLFLFDVDQKLMYGVYKAASPGGYNIEPKAFKSAFPSQVRFTILNDCSPLPEEKFKSAIKGNYYGKNKFNCQLSPEQVKNLCKLFQSAGSTSKKRSGEAMRAELEPSSADRDRRKRHRSEKVRHDRHIPRGRELEPSSADRDRRKRRRSERVRHDHLIPRGRDLYARRESYASPPPRDLYARREPYASPPRDLYARREPYASPPRDLYARREPYASPPSRDLYARREPYASPPSRPLALPPLLPPPSYAYDRSLDDYYYRRDRPRLELRDDRIMDIPVRPQEPIEYRDPYILHREPLPYREALYPSASLPSASLYSAAYAPPLYRL